MLPCYENKRSVWLFKKSTSAYAFPIQMALVATDTFKTHLNQYKEEERPSNS